MKKLKLKDISKGSCKLNLSQRNNITNYESSRIENWIWSASQLLERAIYARKCHLCKCSVQAGEAHLALYNKSQNHFWTGRTNICVFCLESITKTLKRSINGSILQRKQKRKVEMLLDEL